MYQTNLLTLSTQLRASFISINLFSLLCDGSERITTNSMGSFIKYGGPIAYLITLALTLFSILVWFDSGSNLPAKIFSRRNKRRTEANSSKSLEMDVGAEVDAVSKSNDSLRVLHVSKTFRGSRTKAVDNVSFGVSQDTMLALLGPNGAGKTTTFNMIRAYIACCPVTV